MDQDFVPCRRGYLGMRVAYQSHQLKAHWVAALLVYCRWSLSYVYFDTCKFMCTVTINDNVAKNKKMDVANSFPFLTETLDKHLVCESSCAYVCFLTCD